MLLTGDISPLNFGESFIELFTGMSPIAGICYVLGLILIVVEIFQQGAGIFGYIGGALTVLGIVIRISGSGNVAHLFMMVLVALTVLVVAFLIMSRATRMGWISRAARLHPHVDVEEVKGRIGVVLTELAPNGKIELEGRVYDAVTLGDEPVLSESRVRAIGVSDEYVVIEVVAYAG